MRPLTSFRRPAVDRENLNPQPRALQAFRRERNVI